MRNIFISVDLYILLRRSYGLIPCRAVLKPVSDLDHDERNESVTLKYRDNLLFITMLNSRQVELCRSRFRKNIVHTPPPIIEAVAESH